MYPSIITPCDVMAAADCLRWSIRSVTRWGGLVFLWNNILNKDWAEMCGVAYTPSAVTDEPKIHGIAEAGKAPPTGGRVGRMRGTRGNPNAEESEFGTGIRGDTGVHGF